MKRETYERATKNYRLGLRGPKQRRARRIQRAMWGMLPGAATSSKRAYRTAHRRGMGNRIAVVGICAALVLRSVVRRAAP